MTSGIADPRVAIARFAHEPTLEDVFAQIEVFSAARAPLRLWVFSAGVSFSAGELQRIVEAGKSGSIHLARRVAYVSPTDLGFGVSRMFEAYAVDVPEMSRVFRDEAEAMAWLLEDE